MSLTFLVLILFAVFVLIIILSVLVLIHEFGHFIVAKKLGIKVEEFGFGFPPRVFGIKRGETTYSINLLPIGGFVKLYGEDEAGAGRIGKIGDHSSHIPDLKRAFFARPPLQKAAVVIAGVVMNTLLAVVIFSLFTAISNYKTVIPFYPIPPYDQTFLGATQKNFNVNEKEFAITYVSPDSPAEKAGIKTPAQILEINGQKINDRQMFIETINKNKGKEIEITWKELLTGKTRTVALIPRLHPPKNEGSLGVGFFPVAFLTYDTVNQKVLSGLTYPMNLVPYTFNVLGKLVNLSAKTHNYELVGESFSGPVGIYKVVDDILKITNVRDKVLNLLNLAGTLSISLAFFNVLPIPALDGGRLFFILIELFTRRRVSPKFESYAHAIGFVVLIMLVLLITIFDVRKLMR